MIFHRTMPTLDLSLRLWVVRAAKIHFDLPTTVSGDFERALEIKLIESTTASWELRIGLLEAYKEDFGHCQVTNTYKTASGFALGSWVSNQRAIRDKLTPERIQRLDDLGFIWDALAENWKQAFQELTSYKEEFGDCLVPTIYKAASGFKLGSWVIVQRRHKDELTPERIQRLDDLGFVWDSLVEKWEQRFGELASFKDANNHCLVPALFKTASGSALGKWVSYQRKGKEQLTLEHIQRLDDLGFVWDVLAEQWEEGFSELASYKNANNDCRVPAGYKTASGFNLGNWVGKQKVEKEQLIPERFQRLYDLGFVWERLSDKWEQGFSGLAEFKDANNHCLVPHRYINASGLALGKWVSYQRKGKEQLTLEHIQRLDDLGFVWDVLAEQWVKGFQELTSYKNVNNHCRVPQGYKDISGFPLGKWVSDQRNKHKKDLLTPERIQRLDDLGFVWDPLAEQWEEGFSELASYKNANNDCRVPVEYKTASGFNLGSWVGNQRRNKDQFTPDRIQRLDDLGFVWKVK